MMNATFTGGALAPAGRNFARNPTFYHASAVTTPSRVTSTRVVMRRTRIAAAGGDDAPTTPPSPDNPSEMLESAANGASSSLPEPQSSPSPLATLDARSQVKRLIDDGYYTYKGLGALEQPVQAMIDGYEAKDGAVQTMAVGQGVWEVFYMPHIIRASGWTGVRFEPIRYVLRGSEIISNVCYHHPILGEAWLSASGTISPSPTDPGVLKLHFDKFWVDGVDSLRKELPADDPNAFSMDALQDGSLGPVVDGLIGSIGRLFFLEGIADFPVEYLDEDLSVFKFPPLNSYIAIKRVPSETWQ